MDNLSLTDQDTAERTSPPDIRRRGRWPSILLAAVILSALGAGAARLWPPASHPAAPALPPPPVTVSLPLQETVQPTRRFLGQFSAVDSVELRAQVGGTLIAVAFRDGQIVHKGGPLFTIDPRPFQIRLDEAVAQLQNAQARLVLTHIELWRAQQLKRSDYGSTETVDSRTADERAAQAAIQTADATIADARLDLEYANITAPFTGRLGAPLVSVGSLVSGSRGGTSPTTLLATIVSLNPIYLDFDMSESDYLAYQQAHHGAAPNDDVDIALDGAGHFDLHGTLDFIDNVVNRGSGTIHARATVPNPDLSITPGQFARLRLAFGHPEPVLLVPAAAVVPDQSRQIVMAVASNGTIVPKLVETGELYQGLRAIRGGLALTDRVVIDGIVRARPGAKVTPVAGTIKPDPNTATE
jgi:membrane fusion protein, multidrug efflux system